MKVMSVPRAMNAHKLRGPLPEGDERYVMEPKLDGFRLLVVSEDGELEGFARSGNPQDVGVRIPHVVKALLELAPDGYTVLDGELVAPGGEFHGHLTSCMKSYPERCWALQCSEESFLEYVVFDILFLNGVDLRTQPWFVRRDFYAGYLSDLSEMSPARAIDSVPVSSATLSAWVAAGEEGAMIKDVSAPYESGRRTRHWQKRKGRGDTLDVVIMGFTDARYGVGGKFFGQIGAAVFGLYRGGQLVRVGKCSGMDDATRAYMTAHREDLVGRVMTVAHEGFQSHAVRFPQFKGFRDDKPAEECTWDQLN